MQEDIKCLRAALILSEEDSLREKDELHTLIFVQIKLYLRFGKVSTKMSKN